MSDPLKEENACLQAIMDNAPIGISISLKDHHEVLYINRHFTSLFGYTLNDIPTVDEWLKKAYPNAEYRTSVLINSPDSPLLSSKDVWVTCKDGSIRRASRAWTITANRIIVTYTDITELERSRRELEKSEILLSVANDLAKAVPWSFDPKTRKYTFNDAFYALYGTTAEAEGGYEVSLDDYPIRFIHPDSRMNFYTTVREGNKGSIPEILQVEERGLHRGGKDLYVLSRMKTYRDGFGANLQLIGVNQDITEYKQIQASMSRHAEDLACSINELEQFTYVASHDLQEPLRMVTSYTTLLASRYKGKLDSDADEFIGYAVDGANRMKSLINDLLFFSRIGARCNSLKPLNLNAALQQALTNLSTVIEAHHAYVFYDELPTVIADNYQWVQLFQNLIANAVKFRSSAPPRIHISAEEKNNEWIFSIKDNGIGIAPEYYDRIFLIFQRLHKKTEYPGTGIGLAICKRIVERNGGRIWVESELGNGSTFLFTFPSNGEKQ
jgi:signal transduction histidine kinase